MKNSTPKLLDKHAASLLATLAAIDDTPAEWGADPEFLLSPAAALARKQTLRSVGITHTPAIDALTARTTKTVVFAKQASSRAAGQPAWLENALNALSTLIFPAPQYAPILRRYDAKAGISGDSAPPLGWGVANAAVKDGKLIAILSRSGAAGDGSDALTLAASASRIAVTVSAVAPAALGLLKRLLATDPQDEASLSAATALAQSALQSIEIFAGLDQPLFVDLDSDTGYGRISCDLPPHINLLDPSDAEARGIALGFEGDIPHLRVNFVSKAV